MTDLPGMPQVSVLVPMRNAAGFIEECLHSILAEREIDIEVVLIDDGSTDDGPARARALGDARLVLVKGPCLGIAAAINTGAMHARGEILMRCDADDRYPPGRIAAQVRQLAGLPTVAAVCAAFRTVDLAGRPVADLIASIGRDQQDVTDELQDGQARTHLCTFAVRAEAWRAAGGLRPFFETAEDLDFQYRLAGVGKVTYFPLLAYDYRLHDASITHRQADAHRLFFMECATQFAQQRKLGVQDALDRGTPPVPPRLQEGGGSSRRPARLDIQAQLFHTTWQEFSAGQSGKAVRAALSAVRAAPEQWSGWRNLLFIVVRALLHPLQRARRKP